MMQILVQLVRPLQLLIQLMGDYPENAFSNEAGDDGHGHSVLLLPLLLRLIEIISFKLILGMTLELLWKVLLEMIMGIRIPVQQLLGMLLL